MKKNSIINLIIICAIFIALSVVMFNIFSSRKIDLDGTATLTYKYVSHNIEVELTTEESDIVKNILSNKTAHRGSPSCGFSKDASISFGNSTFCIACDSCAIIQYNDRYIDISQSEREVIVDIFNKYGGSFPCV